MQRAFLLLVVVTLAGCAFGVMPDTQNSSFWVEREARIKAW